MLKQTLKIVFYLVISLIIGIMVTLVADSIENITVEKKIRNTLEAEIRNTVVSFKESAPDASADKAIAFTRKYADTVLKDKVLVRGHVSNKLPDSDELLYLFTLKEGNHSLDIFLKNDFLKSELAILDFTDYISGILATIVVFTSIILYTENRKRVLALKQHFEVQHAELSTALEQHKALALLGRMSAALAHELKTPISTISNLIQTLPSRYSDERFVKRFVALVREELNRTQQLIDNLLAYGKDIDTGNEEWISLAPFLHDIAKNNAITISMVDLSNIMIYGDRFYLDLLFKNIFKNSREAGAAKISVQVHLPRPDTDSFAEIVCEDNGVGFPAAVDMEKLTDPFVTSRSRGGGLGLYLAKKIVAAHGGSLSLFRIAQGAGIKLTIPKNRIKTHE
jgi:signal transduction histidine kinase